MLADGPEARPDAVMLAPIAPELWSSVANEVLGCGAGLANRSAEEGRHLPGGQRSREDGHAHGAAGEVVDGDGDPPAQEPYLRQGERQPRDPEADDEHGG